MPIHTHILRERANAEPEDPAIQEQEVLQIIGSLGKDYRSFTHATIEYNSDFFVGESYEFKRQLCTALKAHFAPNQNSFWDKAVAQP